MKRLQHEQSSFLLKIFSTLCVVFLTLTLAILMTGCATTFPKVEADTNKINIVTAPEMVPESELLDIRVKIFDPGELPEDENENRGITEKIRKAEAHFMAFHLKKTLEDSGYWGAVRVIPEGSSDDEISVTGKIIKSNGEELELAIGVEDATGTQWFNESIKLPNQKSFRSAVNMQMLEESSNKQTEVFQNVYNQISNAMVTYRQKLTSKQIQNIRQTAELKFAEDLAPDSFSSYIKKDKNSTIIDRLPSENDDMFKRILKVRERNNQLVDTLDEHYEGLYLGFASKYLDWRKARVSEMNVIREMEEKKNQAVGKGLALAVLGAALGAASSQSSSSNAATGAIAGAAIAAMGVSAMVQSEQIGSEAIEEYQKALEETGASFSVEANSTVLEVEGETVKLTGSAQAKFQQWREVLSHLYKVEMGPELIPVTTSPESQDPVVPNSSQ